MVGHHTPPLLAYRLISKLFKTARQCRGDEDKFFSGPLTLVRNCGQQLILGSPAELPTFICTYIPLFAAHFDSYTTFEYK